MNKINLYDYVGDIYVIKLNYNYKDILVICIYKENGKFCYNFCYIYIEF